MCEQQKRVPMPKTILLAFLAWIYKIAVNFRHMLFDNNILRVNKFDIPIICIGNITVGGTGKTPMTELVVEQMSSKFTVAVLSRGYGRKTKGYLEVKKNSHYRDVGDEPLQIKHKFPKVVVAVCEDRVAGINLIQKLHPSVNLIIMDDGFQHRYVDAKLNIITIDATRPVDRDEMLPLGTLRDVKESLSRAHIFVVTKCPDDMSQLDRSLMRKSLISVAYQQMFFTRYKSAAPVPLFVDECNATLTPLSKVIAVSGVANPKPFVESLKQKYNLVDTLNFNDHHVYKIKDIRHMQSLLKQYPDVIFVITEKDSVKLRVPDKIPAEVRARLFYIPISIEFIDEPIIDFLNKLEHDVREN